MFIIQLNPSEEKSLQGDRANFNPNDELFKKEV